MKIDSYAVSASAVSLSFSQSSTAGVYRQLSGDGTGGGNVLAMNSYRASLSITAVNQTFAGTSGNVGNDKAANAKPEAAKPEAEKEKPDRDGLDISEAAKKKLEKMRLGNLQTDRANGIFDSTSYPSNKDELKVRILEMLLSYINGKECKFDMQPLKDRLNMLKNAMGEGGGASSPPDGSDRRVTEQDITPNQNQPQFSYMQSTQEYRSESISYSAQGIVKTADGKEISFDVTLNMSSEFAQKTFTKGVGSASELGIQLCDPLVINYSGTAASLTQTKFEFDLDFDGSMDNISFAGPGSGFLVLDKNGDGAINDGRELFGPQSGSGFGELSDYDADGNMWIDENDEIYSQLRVWSKDENGNDQLFTLKELDVGAIFLGSTKTSMTMYDQTYNVNGQVQSTGIFLRDSGGAGTIQHIDLAV